MKQVCIGFILVLLTGICPSGMASGSQDCGQIPSDTVLMLDRTSSVSPEERQKEVEAATILIALLLENSGNRVSIGRFGAGSCESSYRNYFTLRDWVDAEILLPLSGDGETLHETLTQNMNEPSCGGTDLMDAIETASGELEWPGNSGRIIILISDGDPNQPLSLTEARRKALAAAAEAKAMGIRIFTIAFDASTANDQENRGLLATMASHDSLDLSKGEVDAGEQESENTDGDDFFIAPNAEHLEPIFRTIGEAILCPDDDEEEQNVFETETPQQAAAEEVSPPSPASFLQGSGCSLNGNPRPPRTGWRSLAALWVFSLPGLAYPRLRPPRLP